MTDLKLSAETTHNNPATVAGNLRFDTTADPAGTPAGGYTEFDDIATVLLAQGYLYNGKISVTVASNNLTVAIKTIAGNDPSTTEPVWVKIADTVHKIIAALSVTKNAGTNWCNAGGAEFATTEVDYFAYLGYNATDGVVIGFSRACNASIYSDFSTTSTNEKYCAISTIANAAAGDNYVIVGRFAATLSAGAGYTWSVPTFTTINLVQRPIYETRWMTWVPTLTGYSSNPPSGIYRYQWVGKNITIIVREGSGDGTSSLTTLTLTGVFTAKNISGMVWDFPAAVTDNSVALTTPGIIRVAANGSLITIFKDYSPGAFTNTGGKRCRYGSVTYEAA